MERKYKLDPCKGFDNIKFSEKRDDVRMKLGQHKEFKKNIFSKNSSDDFGDFHAYYDENNTLEAVEFFEGNVYLAGDKLFPNSKSALFEILKKSDGNAALTEDSISSSTLYISVYAPDEKAESLLIHREGYF